MTNYYYESESIGADDGTTFWWHQLPNQIGPLLLSFGPNIVVQDDRGNHYSGDDFWDNAGGLRWEIGGGRE